MNSVDWESLVIEQKQLKSNHGIDDAGVVEKCVGWPLNPSYWKHKSSDLANYLYIVYHQVLNKDKCIVNLVGD